MELKESCGRVRERIEKARRVKETIRRPIELASLGLWWLTEAGPPTREHEGAGCSVYAAKLSRSLFPAFSPTWAA